MILKEYIYEFNFPYNKLEYLMKKSSLTHNDMKTLKEDLLLNNHLDKYKITATPLEEIINIILSKNPNIKIDYKDNNNEPALYYYNNDNLYLINYDSIEALWYFSLLESESFNLLEEIFCGSYYDFIDYLKNKEPLKNQ